MDLDVYNSSIHYEERIYNHTSEVIAEQTKILNEMHTTNGHYLLQSNRAPADLTVYNDEENYVIKHFESSNTDSPGYEVITVDPNSFYSSDDEDIVVDIESDQSETNDEHDSKSNAESVNGLIAPQSTAQHPSTASVMDDTALDITSVNINDLYAVDDHLLTAHDDILFANGIGDLGQFDLAHYVDGGGSSLLLSPPPVTIARQCTPLKITPAKMAMTALSRTDTHREEHDSGVSREQQHSKSNAQSAGATTLDSRNRRKRRNLTKAFIDTTDDSDSDLDATKQNEKMLETKKQRRKEDDPIWNPTPNGGLKVSNRVKNDVAMTTKETASTKKSDEQSSKERRAEKVKSPSSQSTSHAAPLNGLRTMLKKQMLSNRPIKKNSMNMSKKLASPPKATACNPNSVSGMKQKFGVGRGKDISITAKYFNSSSKSSDNSDRDSTDNEIINLDVESGSESESDASNSVRSKERCGAVEKSECKDAKDCVEEITAVSKNKVVDKGATGTESKPKEAKDNGRAITKVPLLMDNADFAKAIFVDAKDAAKVKPGKREESKKSSTEQTSKRPSILYSTGNKFKTNCLPPVVNSRPFTELRPPNSNLMTPKEKNMAAECVKSAIKLPKIPLLRQTKIEKTSTKDTKKDIEVAPIEESKADATAAATAKKKLNIQEYLKRKSLNPLVREKVKVCREMHPFEESPKTNVEPAAGENDQALRSETSLYEEIISVSMGCGTDISIPECRVDGADASSTTVLLSNIQTTIEKAASEQGKISSNSLISSIQDVILKKTTRKAESDDCVPEKKPAENETQEHGENKVITHLRKDRVRPTTVTIAIQTDPYFQFPPLERFALPAKKNEHFDRCKSLGRGSLGDPLDSDIRSMRSYSMQNDRFTNREYRMRKDQSESSYYSDEGQQQMSSPQRRSRHSEYLESIAHPSSHGDFHRRHRRSSSYRKNRNYRSKFDRDSQRHRTISRSLSQSSDSSSSSHSSTSTSASSASSVSSASSKSLNSYGDSSTKSYYGDDHCNHRRNLSAQSWHRGRRNQQMPNHRSDSPEHRRIVYVGRLESETTKDDLRRIFSVYGRVENVTLHYKEMKWKYGFVTFERPADAYKAIDTSSKNPALKDYDISFGGRRAFCREKYLDLDNTEDDYSQTMHPMARQPHREDDSFESLLRKLKEKLQDTKE